jgi:hypothetical protein
MANENGLGPITCSSSGYPQALGLYDGHLFLVPVNQIVRVLIRVEEQP